MGLILLEALLALVLLVAIVWWTMFSGRKRGELTAPVEAATPSVSDSPPAAAPDTTPGPQAQAAQSSEVQTPPR